MSDTTTPAVPAVEPASTTPVVAASTAPVAPSAATTVPAKPSPTFGQYLKDNIPNHLKLLFIIFVIGASVYGYITIKGLKAQLADSQQVTSTLSQKYQQVGPAAISGNATASAPAVQQQASDAFGSALVSIMQQQGSQINSLTTALGQTNSAVTTLATQASTFTATQQNTTTGKLSAYPMDESRVGAPPLSTVNLFYDPTQHDPTKAFAGTSWTHNQEQFSTSVGEWSKSKDGGMSTTLKLSRTISKPDPANPGKLILIGSEDIPITGSNTVYTPAGVLAGAPQTVPRWTLGLGLSKVTNTNGAANTVTSGIGVFGSMDYRVTDRYGMFIGTANNGLLGGISIRLDSK